MDEVLKALGSPGIDEIMDEAIKEEMMKSEEEAIPLSEIEMLADSINTKIAEQGSPARTFMLNEPAQLTVRREGKPNGYSKRPHIGGENFELLRCYAGKKRQLIYVFRPLEVADYVEMEMLETAAKTSLSGFSGWTKTLGSEFEREKGEVMNAAALKRERERLAARENNYGDFGSW